MARCFVAGRFVEGRLVPDYTIIPWGKLDVPTIFRFPPGFLTVNEYTEIYSFPVCKNPVAICHIEPMICISGNCEIREMQTFMKVYIICNAQRVYST